MKNILTSLRKLKGMFESYGHPYNDELWRLKGELQDSGVEDWRAALPALNNPRVNMVLRWHDLSRQVNDWDSIQPEVLEIEQRNYIIHAAYKKWQGTVSFVDNKLCQAGTLIECEDTDGKTFQLLIGSINKAGGVCDDCKGIENDTIVKRCCIVWSPENKEKENAEP